MVTVAIQVPLRNADAVQKVIAVLKVDPAFPNTIRGLQYHSTQRQVLTATVRGEDVRAVRLATHALLEQLKLIVRTMEEFDVSVQ